ncbi:hypothetical protein D0962_30065 [Leptolyngbyaceae cyanobacterium CCMR0082]|uniref:Uncharacterized protein n=2 Tax=Adonisia turfae TaxID=2950184 RepID=A0A6M0SH69_9CYAN|nr:hypothetical protein [Adonisia turfae CCMR0081]NEZ66952.1 hypothetical protein [Adonisia turfae CCMR0082]
MDLKALVELPITKTGWPQTPHIRGYRWGEQIARREETNTLWLHRIDGRVDLTCLASQPIQLLPIAKYLVGSSPDKGEISEIWLLDSDIKASREASGEILEIWLGQ